VPQDAVRINGFTKVISVSSTVRSSSLLAESCYTGGPVLIGGV